MYFFKRKVAHGSLFLSMAIFLLFSCSNYEKNSTHQNTADSSIRAGEKLARRYCQGCHLFPEPSLLNSDSWSKGVLPNIGPVLEYSTLTGRATLLPGMTKMFPQGFILPDRCSNIRNGRISSTIIRLLHQIPYQSSEGSHPFGSQRIYFQYTSRHCLNFHLPPVILKSIPQLIPTRFCDAMP